MNDFKNKVRKQTKNKAENPKIKIDSISLASLVTMSYSYAEGHSKTKLRKSLIETGVGGRAQRLRRTTSHSTFILKSKSWGLTFLRCWLKILLNTRPRFWVRKTWCLARSNHCVLKHLKMTPKVLFITRRPDLKSDRFHSRATVKSLFLCA